MTDASSNHDALRGHLLAVLSWEDAHAGFETAVAGLPAELRGRQPEGLPYSPWQLIEHMRIAQRDILDFCLDPRYRQPDWPGDYWPEGLAPPDSASWEASVEGFRSDREELKRLVQDPAIDLFAVIPHGDGQTYLREVLLAADHGAYHVGQLVAVRRLLGAWE
jgi:hypothetical protein